MLTSVLGTLSSMSRALVSPSRDGDDDGAEGRLRGYEAKVERRAVRRVIDKGQGSEGEGTVLIESREVEEAESRSESGEGSLGDFCSMQREYSGLSDLARVVADTGVDFRGERMDLAEELERFWDENDEDDFVEGIGGIKLFYYSGDGGLEDWGRVCEYAECGGEDGALKKSRRESVERFVLEGRFHFNGRVRGKECLYVGTSNAMECLQEEGKVVMVDGKEFEKLENPEIDEGEIQGLVEHWTLPKESKKISYRGEELELYELVEGHWFGEEERMRELFEYTLIYRYDGQKHQTELLGTVGELGERYRKEEQAEEEKGFLGDILFDLLKGNFIYVKCVGVDSWNEEDDGRRNEVGGIFLGAEDMTQVGEYVLEKELKGKDLR